MEKDERIDGEDAAPEDNLIEFPDESRRTEMERVKSSREERFRKYDEILKSDRFYHEE